MSNIANVHEKIHWYTSSNKELAPLINKPLSLLSNNEAIKKYAVKVTKANPLGNSALDVYATIYQDTYLLEKTDDVNFVSTMYEYYFTDLVFIQQKYEEALLDLLHLKAEYFDIRAIETAINNTLHIATQSGYPINQKQLLDKYSDILDQKIAIMQHDLTVQISEYFPYTAKYARKIAQSVRQYYLDPTVNSYQELKNSFVTFQEAIKNGPAIFVGEMDIRCKIAAEITYIAKENSGLDLPSFPNNIHEKILIK